jgi:hypothetical protein
VPSQLPHSLPQSTAPAPCGIILEPALLVLVCKLVAAQWLCRIVLANCVKTWGGMDYTYRGHSSCLCRLSEPRKITALNLDLYILSKLSTEGRSTKSSPGYLQAHRAVAGKAESGRRCQRFEHLRKSLSLRTTTRNQPPKSISSALDITFRRSKPGCRVRRLYFQPSPSLEHLINASRDPR